MNWSKLQNQNLIQAFLSLTTKTEAKNFLRDLMTEKELTELANRLEAAFLLQQKMAYTKIEQQTGLSSTTIARVAKWLNGTLGGYRLILKKIHHRHSSQLRRELS